MVIRSVGSRETVEGRFPAARNATAVWRNPR